MPTDRLTGLRTVQDHAGRRSAGLNSSSTLIRINVRESETPLPAATICDFGAEARGARAIEIPMGASEALLGIQKFLQEF